MTIAPEAETSAAHPARPGQTPNLNKALAAFKAEMPVIYKGEEGKIEGQNKEGRYFSYTYGYADLAAITEVADPILGRHGLAFTSRPTLDGGGFVLAYSLVHESGEQLDGVFPLPSTAKPQDLGKLLTYYRRYAFCAVLNIAPAKEDDDASAVNKEQRFDARSAGAAFDQATPAQTRRPRGNGGGNGQTVRPAREEPPGTAPGGSADDIDPDAQAFADEAHEATSVGALKDIHRRAVEAHKLAALVKNPATGGIGGYGQYENWRKRQLEEAEAALADLNLAAAGLPGVDVAAHVTAVTGAHIENATAAQLRQAIEALPQGAPA